METGSMLWSQQMTPGDGWNFSCMSPNKASCPESQGEDLDFGSSPILKTVRGKDLLIVGQKSGVVHALDPSQLGKIVWQTRIGHGGALGGIEWGSAGDGRKGVERTGAEAALPGQGRLHRGPNGGGYANSRRGVFRLHGRASAR